ncbi:MAG: hypothetical protein IJC44_02160, partial [Clostridia bacterium]|nr:hypothetical protein [Clostridia bacterium]
YNITARMFDRDGINPMTEIEFAVVERSAQLIALENGELDAVLLPDAFSYDMRKDAEALYEAFWNPQYDDGTVTE